MDSSTESIRNTHEVAQESAMSYTKTSQAHMSPEPLPSSPARDCGKCLFAAEGLHTYDCHRAIAATMQEYIQVAENALLPVELNPGSNTKNQGRQGKAGSDRRKTSGNDQGAALILESLQPGQHPTSSLENFAKFAMAVRVKEATQLQKLDQKQAVADDLYDTMISHYHDSPDGHELFIEWHKAVEEVFECMAEKWELKQEVERMSVQAVEASKKRLAGITEHLGEREGRRESDGELNDRMAELDIQSERIDGLEAELREIKAKLLDLEAERKVD